MEVSQKNYELIIVIVNQGYTGVVMDAAKECGARGGTTFVAHGTGNKELGTFFGIVIQPEKEIVFILVDEEIKDKVMLNIYKQAGLETKGSGIAFSIKVSDVIGLTPFEKHDNEKSENDGTSGEINQ